MTDEQATPAHFFHPLFAGMVPSLIDAPCASTFQRLAQGLGFMSTCLRLNLGGSDEPGMAQPWIEGGYRMAARWPAGNATVLVYLKPTTAFAEAIWLAGLGVIEQGREVEKAWGHNGWDEDSFRGWHKVTEEAIAEAQKAAIESGRSQFEVKLFTLPVASRFIAAEDVLQQMYERAQDEAGECADDFPSYDRESKNLLEGALSLLVDGWAVATDNVPTFSSDSEQAKTYDVFDPRSLAP